MFLNTLFVTVQAPSLYWTSLHSTLKEWTTHTCFPGMVPSFSIKSSSPGNPLSAKRTGTLGHPVARSLTPIPTIPDLWNFFAFLQITGFEPDAKLDPGSYSRTQKIHRLSEFHDKECSLNKHSVLRTPIFALCIYVWFACLWACTEYFNQMHARKYNKLKLSYVLQFIM